MISNPSWLPAVLCVLVQLAVVGAAVWLWRKDR
jgi:hypothetical protein